MERCKFLVIFTLLMLLHLYRTLAGYIHQHPGFAQRLQIKPGCLQVPQQYTEAPTEPTITFSSLERVNNAEAEVEAD